MWTRSRDELARLFRVPHNRVAGLRGAAGDLLEPHRPGRAPGCGDLYAFLTIVPNALVATVNHERMPVLLMQEDEFEAWLNGSRQRALQLVQSCQSCDAERMRIVQSGSDQEDLLGGYSPAAGMLL